MTGMFQEVCLLRELPGSLDSISGGPRSSEEKRVVYNCGDN